ncbi:MAG: CoA transferase [Candidatus Tectimicrobiota bacterium]|nr:MAG: CoA transferase [Candidatus Tectomicrobia bacterium]
MAGPLQGIRVLDLSNWIAGPFGTMLLGDLGAEVIKVESPAGDGCRALGPPFQKGEAHFFMGVNRNKRSLVVDLKTPQGQAVVRDLALQCDVLVQNMRPGVAERYGLGYESLRAYHPRLIYVTNTGYGNRGPLRDMPGFDLVMQGIGGVMHRGEAPPEFIRAFPPADMGTGMLIAYAVCAALYHRERTGQGQLIDTSLFATILALQSGILFFGEQPPPFTIQEIAPYIPTYRAYRDAEGAYFTVAALSEEQWRRLCQVVGLEALATDARFDSLEKRLNAAEELIPLLQQQFAQRPRAYWIAALNAQHIPSGPVYTHEELRREPHVQEMNLLPTVHHPVAGRTQLVGPPVVFHATPASIRRPAPLHGQHSEEVLREFGYDEARIRALREAGVIYQWQPPEA